MPIEQRTKQQSWKKSRDRETIFHSHPSDNFSDDGGEGEAEADAEKSFLRFRRHKRTDVILSSKQDNNSLGTIHPHFIESDDEENGIADDMDVNCLSPPMKLKALHQRHAATTATNGDRLQLPLRQPLQKNQKIKRETDGQTFSRGSTKRNDILCGISGPKGNRLIRHCFLLGIAIYFLVMVIQSQFLYQQRQSSLAGPSPTFITREIHESRSRSQVRLTAHERARMMRELRKRKRDRKQRTTPPPRPSLSASTLIPLYDVHSLENEEEPVDHLARSELQRPANLDELCGLHAQESALANPYSYLSRDSLNTNARVLIAGILNPIGFHLALALKERCGVESIIGIDPMFPNTAQNRLALLEQMKILTTNIPQLVQPIALPMTGLDPRLRKRDPLASITLLNSTGELNLLSSQPTHIVHLASYAPDMYIMESLNKKWRNSFSPYVTEGRNPPMLRLQSSAASMEQILASIATADKSERPHLTYGSVAKHEEEPSDRFYTCSKQADDILVDTYHSMCATFAVGLRLPNAVYGPWARAGNAVHDLAQSLVTNWNLSASDREALGGNVKDSTQLDLLYVDDVVDAIIASMQFRSESSSPVIFDVTSGSTSSHASLENMLMSLRKKETNGFWSTLFPDLSHSALSIQQFIHWRPKTMLREGLLKTIAWHLDRHQPFGRSSIDPSPTLTGDEFLTMHSAPTCSGDDILCHAGHKYIPCISECASKTNCTPSIFHDIVEIARDISAGCDVVMYTQSLGRDVEDLDLQVKYIDDSSPQICNLAFVPRDSQLVDTVVRKVPSDQLVKFGVAPQPGEAEGDGVTQGRKLEGLNGNLLYRGWILIWVKDAMSPLSPLDEAMLKIAPGRFFSSDVKSAVFVDQNFSVSPTVDDITFLFDELSRSPLKQRAAYQTVTNGKVKKKAKYVLAPEPARRATILVSKLKVPLDPNEALTRDRKISVYDATKFMRAEMGLDPEAKESPELQRQREFYERVPSFVNQHDMKSSLEPLYYYEMKHWIRSRWVVHDLRMEESRQLRCDWYQEHIQWGAELDQLSFAHVMAKIELKRKITHNEPDEHTKPFFIEHPELLSLSDAHEWHALNTGRTQAVNLVIKKVPDHLVDAACDGDELSVAAQASKEVSAGSELPIIFVRIMSENAMATSRALWMQTKWQRSKL